MPYHYANGTVSEVPPFMAFDVFPQGDGYIYSKLALDGLIKTYCGELPMQVQAAKWRILAILGNEYKSLSSTHRILALSDRLDDPVGEMTIKKMVAIDQVMREYSKELLGKEM